METDVLVWGTHDISTAHYQYFRSISEAVEYINKFLTDYGLDDNPYDYITYHANGVLTKRQTKDLTPPL
jgi:hypothetical protein